MRGFFLFDGLIMLYPSRLKRMHHHYVTVMVLVSVCLFASPTYGTIHYSGERYAELPASWKGFLTDHRMLRMVGIPASPKLPPSLLRLEYQAAVERLLTAKKQRTLRAGELADLGALYLRLGQVDSAINVLRPAAAEYPREFAIQANLGSAWHLAGNWSEAVEHLRQAVKLAPVEFQPLESLHLKLVLIRMRSTPASGIDPLFGIQFVTGDGIHRLGKLTQQERDTLPKGMVALTQRLALSFPNDPLLLWQLGELSVVFGDLASASSLLDLCVGEYSMSHADLRKSRQAILAAIEGNAPVSQAKSMEAHARHGSGVRLEFRSRKPIIQQAFDVSRLESTIAGQPNLLAWPILAETATDPRRFKPSFHPYLQKLENKQVALTGFLHPLTDDLDCTSFLLVEYPIGCWYCTAPDLTGIVFVSMPPGTTARFTRDAITVTGKWKLNNNDPEEFLYSITEAAVHQPK